MTLHDQDLTFLISESKYELSFYDKAEINKVYDCTSGKLHYLFKGRKYNLLTDIERKEREIERARKREREMYRNRERETKLKRRREKKERQVNRQVDKQTDRM